MEMYELVRNGMVHTVQLTKLDAQRYGAKPVSVKPAVKARGKRSG